jgi:hypothetical protein
VTVASIVVAAASTALSRREVVIYLQAWFGVPGDHFVVGSRVIEKRSDWLLRSSRASAGDRVKLYGFLAVPNSILKPTVPSRYFSFQVRDDTGNGDLTFMEPTPELNEAMQKSIDAPNGPLPEHCQVEKDVWDGLPGVQCNIEGGGITYIPIARLQIIVLSGAADWRQYLKGALR